MGPITREANSPAMPAPPAIDQDAHLRSLAEAMNSAGMTAVIDGARPAVLVTRRGTDNQAVRVTVERNTCDGWALWFVHPGGPLAPAHSPRSAVRAIGDLLQPETLGPGA